MLGRDGGAPRRNLPLMAQLEDGSRRVDIHDWASGRLLRRLPLPMGYGNSEALSADARWLFRESDEGTVLQDLKAGTTRRFEELEAPECAAFSADGAYLACYDAFAGLLVYRVGDGARVRRWPKSEASPRRLVLGPKAERALAICWGAPELWGVGAKPVRVRLPHRRGVRVSDAAFSPDGRKLAIADADGRVWICDRDGRAKHELPTLPRVPTWAAGTTDRETSVAFSPDGGRLAVVVLHALQVWDVRGAPRRLDDCVEQPIRMPEIQISADERWLLAADLAGGRVALWDLRARRRVWTVATGCLLSAGFDGDAVRVRTGAYRSADPRRVGLMRLALADGRALPVPRAEPTAEALASCATHSVEPAGSGARLVRHADGAILRRLPAGRLAVTSRWIVRVEGAELVRTGLAGGEAARVRLPAVARARLAAGHVWQTVAAAPEDPALVALAIGPEGRAPSWVGRFHPCSGDVVPGPDRRGPLLAGVAEVRGEGLTLSPVLRGREVQGLLVRGAGVRLGLPVGRLGTQARMRHAILGPGRLLRLDRGAGTVAVLDVRGRTVWRRPLPEAGRRVAASPEYGVTLKVSRRRFVDVRFGHVRGGREVRLTVDAGRRRVVEGGDPGLQAPGYPVHGWQVDRVGAGLELLRWSDGRSWALPPGAYAVVGPKAMVRLSRGQLRLYELGEGPRLVGVLRLPAEARRIEGEAVTVVEGSASPDGRYAMLTLVGESRGAAWKVPVDLKRRRCGEAARGRYVDAAVWVRGRVVVNTEDGVLVWDRESGTLVVDAHAVKDGRGVAQSASGRVLAVSQPDSRVAVFVLERLR